ncbi:MAG: gliding motility protein GldM [Paludibacteraceae bacterium]|nr:gliding motility protein GldM [Paludibacteraceae bacterium]
MMYLVLTAMLALNVSADIINGYAKVDDSLHSTINTVEAKNEFFYRNFKSMMDQNPEKTKEWYERSLQLKEQSDSIYNYIQNFKDELVLMADGSEAPKNATVGQLNKKDDTNIPHNYGLNQKNGEILKNRVVEYREFLKGLCNNRLDKEFDVTFAVSDGVNADGETISWEATLFHEMPLCATLTMLSKIQNDIRTEESNVLTWLTNQTDAGDLRVNKLQAYVIPKSDYVIRGGKYSAQIILAAIDSTQNPEYYIEGQRINDNGLYEVTATGTGLKKFKGSISFLNNMGEMENLPFESSYSVGEPSVTISNTDLNIMYRKHENKFSISVPGVSNDKIKVSVSGATVRQSGGMWVIVPGESAKEVSISVQAEIEGKMQAMGSQKYRVKPLPQPGAYFKSREFEYSDGYISRSALLQKDATIIASYGPDGLLNLPFTIVGFKVKINGTFYDVKGNKFTQNEINKLGQLKQGADIIIADIRAKGPNGDITKLKSLLLTLN